MPAISAAAQRIISDAKFSTADVGALRTAVRAGEATVKDVEQIATRFIDALEGGVGGELQKLLRELGGNARMDAPIANLGSSPALLNGTVLLPRDKDTRKAEVTSVQKALIALASRTADPAMMLPRYGADGGWGGETENALKAFQTKKGLPPTGTVDMATAQALDRELRNTRIPPIFAGGVDPNMPTPDNVVRGARALVEKHGPNYGVPGAWKNIDSRHAMHTTYGRPLNSEANATKDRWKCNLFACATLVAAGFEPPYYNGGTSGEYPNANQLYKFSDKYQSDRSKQRFELKAEVLDIDQISDPALREARIKEALSKAEPGDLVIVDHVGDLVSDGGHCRVLCEKMPDGSFQFAQASSDAAREKNETWTSFNGEQALWILKPTKRRPEGAAAVT